jgi:(4S)-4-hydroxy-5-phosphonooxypentane-2,3-dione isomerase
MSGYVVLVDFRLKAGARAAFRELVEANARQSAREEPGCARFDVVAPEGADDSIFLYEIYKDRAAFEAHLRSAHYARFDAASADHVVSKSVRFGERVCEGSG